MNQLQRLHEAFIEKANRPMDFGSLPISPHEAEAPIFPVERWRAVDGALYKTYKFRRDDDRNEFILLLLAYEKETDHHAEITIKSDEVTLRVQTKDLEKVTSIDKEYARYADVVHKDLIYRPEPV